MLYFSDWERILMTSVRLIKDNSKMLSELDSIIGDGDHGITIERIANVIETSIETWDHDKLGIKEMLESLGWKIMDVNGGSAGPLWGTMFIGLSNGLENEKEVDEDGLKKMFNSSLKAMKEISDARVGDKTMMDVLIPVVETIRNSDDDIPTMLKKAAKVANEAANDTAKYAAKFGRAKNLKAKSIGHKDPGAVSLSLLFIGLAEGLESNNP